jgi:hypothetical protein
LTFRNQPFVGMSSLSRESCMTLAPIATELKSRTPIVSRTRSSSGVAPATW